MSFRFFRPWEDDWRPSTCQTPAPHHVALAIVSGTIKPTRVQSSPNTCTHESRSSSGKARNVSQMVPEAHETPSEVRKTHTATTTAMKDENSKQALEKTSSSTYSQSVQSPTGANNAVSRNLTTSGDCQEAWQNDHAGHATSANKSLLPMAISTASVASSSLSNTSTAHDKNDPFKNTLGNSLCESKKLSALTCRNSSKHSVMLLQSRGTENGTGEHHEQVLISDNSKQEQHHTAGKLFKCSLCEKAFPKLQNVHKHERTHSGSKSFQYTYCGKVFTWKSHLCRHQQTHTGSKPFQCTACEKAFAQSSDLHNHERIHTGSRPFKCNFCEKAFSVPSNLHTHIRTHTGSKPFKCNFCGKAFSQSSTLHRHERTHTRSKPFKCRFCEKAFTQSSNLQVHERIHTGIRPFKCTYCDKAFSKLSNLYRHKRIHASSKSSLSSF